jgi:hypothetical protein
MKEDVIRTDKKILKSCITHLNWCRGINVPHYIRQHLPENNKLGAVEFKSLCARIHSRLLEDNKFIPHPTRRDEYGLSRVIFAKREKKALRFIKASLKYAILPLIVGIILWLVDWQCKARKEDKLNLQLKEMSESLKYLQKIVFDSIIIPRK